MGALPHENRGRCRRRAGPLGCWPTGICWKLFLRGTKWTPTFNPVLLMRILATAFLAFVALGLRAENKVVRLYDGPAPGSESWTHSEKDSFTNLWNGHLVYNVANPTLTVFPPDPAKANGTAVIICPGGAFIALSIE